MTEIQKPFGDNWEIYWKNGFSPMPAQDDGKKPALSGIHGHNGKPEKGKLYEVAIKYARRNMLLALYFQKDGQRDETEAMFIVDDDNETSEMRQLLESESGASLDGAIEITGRSPDSARKKYLFRYKGSRKKFRPVLFDGSIQICSDTLRYVALLGTHKQTGLDITISKNGKPLGRPLKRSDIPYAPQALIDYLIQDEAIRLRGDGEHSTAEFVNHLDAREPSNFARDFLEQLEANREFGNSKLYEHLAHLVILVNLRERGTQHVFEKLSRLWHGREHVSGNPEKEWEHSLNSAVSVNWQGPQEQSDKTLQEVLVNLVDAWKRDSGPISLEESFFAEACDRPLFAHILEVSRITGDLPIALVGSVLLQAAYETPYNVYLKSSLGEEPLNLLAVFCGPTGSGKSAVMHNGSSDLYFLYPRLRPFVGPNEPISGEGANMAFVIEEKRKGSSRAEYRWKFPGHNEIFVIDEVGLLEARSSRQGSTMKETLLTHHSGSAISRSRADGSVMTLGKNSYRSVWMIGAQPSRTGFFFDEEAIAQGLAGRCIWLPVVSKDADSIELNDDFDYANFDILSPEELNLIPPFVVKLPEWNSEQGPHYIKPTIELHKELRLARKLGQLGKANPLESHTVRVKARLSALLAFLDERTSMNDQDVLLSEILIQISRRTYLEALQELAKAQNDSLAAKGSSDGIRRHHGARRERQLDIKQHAGRIQQKLLEQCGSEPMTTKQLRQVYKNNFNEKSREEYWSEAIEHLASSPQLPEQLKKISFHEEERLQELESRQVRQTKP